MRRFLFPLAQDYGCNYTTYRVVQFANNDQMLRAVVRLRLAGRPCARRKRGACRAVIQASRASPAALAQTAVCRSCRPKQPKPFPPLRPIPVHKTQTLGLVDAGHAALTKNIQRAEIVDFTTGW